MRVFVRVLVFVVVHMREAWPVRMLVIMMVGMVVRMLIAVIFVAPVNMVVERSMVLGPHPFVRVFYGIGVRVILGIMQRILIAIYLIRHTDNPLV